MKLLKNRTVLGGTLHCSVPAHLFCSDTACECRTVPKDHNRAFCKGR